MNSLFLITARGGSKGLPGKNIKSLNGRPLISYSIEFAREFVKDDCICLSTDDHEIIDVANQLGLDVPFVRPAELATDVSGSYDVIRHAMNYYKEAGVQFDNIVLLQPTSPIRKNSDLQNMLQLYHSGVDAVVSVKIAEENPLYNLYKENNKGILEKFYEADVQTRQAVDKFYYLNGSIYVLNCRSIEKYASIPEMPKKVKYEMDRYHSIDIDDAVDFEWCQFVMKEKLHL